MASYDIYDNADVFEATSFPRSSTSRFSHRSKSRSLLITSASSEDSNDTSASSVSLNLTEGEGLCSNAAGAITVSEIREWNARSRSRSSSLSITTEGTFLSARTSPTSICSETSYQKDDKAAVPPKEEHLKTADALSSLILCCDHNEKYSHEDHDGSAFSAFLSASFQSISQAKTSNIDTNQIKHMIELISTISGQNPLNRYFALLTSTKQYQEITPDFFQTFDNENAYRGAKSYYTCAEHKQAWQFVIIERRELVKEVLGWKRPELSAREIARDKRRITFCKTTYGRKEELGELLGKKLSTVSDELYRQFDENDFFLAGLSLDYKRLTGHA